MMWSKVRSQIRDLVVSELRGRIDVHCTRYRDAHDEEGEAWITVDKQKVDGGGYYHWHMARPPNDMMDRQAPALFSRHAEYLKAKSEDADVRRMQRIGVHDTFHVTGSLRTYLSTSIEDALNATNPIIRAFSMVDRRLGKRRFLDIEISEDDYPLVVRFHSLRLELFQKKA
jgi:hypothetical protein